MLPRYPPAAGFSRLCRCSRGVAPPALSPRRDTAAFPATYIATLDKRLAPVLPSTPMAESGERRISLLWPPDREPKPGPAVLDARTAADLDLQDLVYALCGSEPKRQRFVTAVLSELCTDPEVIRFRQDVLADLLSDVALRRSLAAVLPSLGALIEERQSRVRQNWVVAQIAQRLVELERYVDAAVQLRDALAEAPVRSAALRSLRDHILARTTNPEFETLQRELPGLRATLDQARSVTIGINFTQ